MLLRLMGWLLLKLLRQLVSRASKRSVCGGCSTLRVEPNGFASREDVTKHEVEFAMIQRDILELRQQITDLKEGVDEKIADLKENMATKSDLKDNTIKLGGMIMALGTVLIAIKYFG